MEELNKLEKQQEGYKVFAGGFSINTTEEDLFSYMSDFGKVYKVKIHRKRGGESRGFGFVFFASETAAKKAIKARHSIEGKKFSCQQALDHQEAKKKELEERARKIFIGGFSKDVDEEELFNHFEKFGEVESVIISKEYQTEKSRGCGFITFRHPNSALDAIYPKYPHTIRGQEFGCQPCKLRSEIQEERHYKNNRNNFRHNDRNHRRH